MLQLFDAVFPLRLILNESGALCEGTEAEEGRPFSIASVLEGEEIQGVEARFTREDGERFNLLVSAGRLFGAGSRKIGCVVSLTSISERKRAEELLKRKTQEAQEASRLKSHFVSNVSHELRTPLNSIIGYTYLLLDEAYGELQRAQRSSLEAVSRNAKDLLHLVDDLLNLSRIEAGKLSLQVETVRLHPLVEEIVTAAKPLLGEKSLEVELQIPPEVPKIQSDGGKVKQILVNLISNAIKFTNDGKIVVTVEDRLKKEGVEIKIKDSGIGIQPEQLPKIFDAFHQADSDLTREYGGVGLGLTIVKELVSCLHGEIDVESEYGDGSTFTLFLPYRFE